MGVFSRFLSCTNGIKSRNASHMYNMYPKIKPATSTTMNIRIVRQKTQDNCNIIYVVR